MRVSAIVIYLLFALSSWTFMTISTFKLMHNSNFNTRLTAVKDPNEIIIDMHKIMNNLRIFEHFWGGEHEESRFLGIPGFTMSGKGYSPSSQFQVFEETLIVQTCKDCGAVRKRNKYVGWKVKDSESVCGAQWKNNRNPWSVLWQKKTVTPLACSLESRNVTYEDYYVGNILFTKFAVGNISYALAKDKYYDDEINIYTQDLSNNTRWGSKMKV
jgi:hypothetical protein